MGIGHALFSPQLVDSGNAHLPSRNRDLSSIASWAFNVIKINKEMSMLVGFIVTVVGFWTVTCIQEIDTSLLC